MRIERIAPFLGAELHDRAPFPLEAFLQKPGEHLFQWLALQVIEKDLGHSPPPWRGVADVDHQIAGFIVGIYAT